MIFCEKLEKDWALTDDALLDSESVPPERFPFIVRQLRSVVSSECPPEYELASFLQRVLLRTPQEIQYLLSDFASRVFLNIKEAQRVVYKLDESNLIIWTIVPVVTDSLDDKLIDIEDEFLKRLIGYKVDFNCFPESMPIPDSFSAFDRQYP